MAPLGGYVPLEMQGWQVDKIDSRIRVDLVLFEVFEDNLFIDRIISWRWMLSFC